MTVIAPAVTPELAERSLIGAAIHAFAARVKWRASESDQTDLEFARRIPAAAELAESATVYAVSLVWWAHRDRASRAELLERATELMLARVTESASDRAYEAGYRIYANRLAKAALAPQLHAKELDLAGLVSGVAEIDLLTARFADTTVDGILLADCRSFGDPKTSAETMRDEMISLAYLPHAA
jgi:hypothetical protein